MSNRAMKTPMELRRQIKKKKTNADEEKRDKEKASCNRGF